MLLETQLKSKSYYELLEVTPAAGDEEIKRAYRRLALKFHPDRRSARERHLAELRFRLINEAYAHLKTAEKRAAYNLRLNGQNDNHVAPSLWNQFFGILKARPKARHEAGH